jgi:predicted nuclease of predicted toxin-antitoxin system
LRFLIDNALSPLIAARLRAGGHDAVHVRDYGLHAGSDEEILDKASMERRVVISADADFGTLLATRRTSLPSVVLFRRCTQRRPEEQATLLLDNLPAIEQALEAGSVVVIEPDRIRLRRLPLLP